MLRKAILVTTLGVALNACDPASPTAVVSPSSSSQPSSAGSGSNPSANPTPCIDASCATKTEHLHIFDAENSAFSSDGRLFVSGQDHVLEISKDNSGNLQSSVISSTLCNYTGLTVRGTTLYAACFDNTLHAADINALPLSQIYTVNSAQATNGLTHLGSHLYVTDGPLSLPSRINQLQIDSSNPLNITGQAAWTTPGELSSANGLQTVNGEIWVTSANQIVRYAVDSSGNKGASSTVLTHATLAFDDFTVLSDGNIVVADLNNAVHLFDGAGALLETSTNVAGPSSAIQGQGPMFNVWDIIVTEKGTLGDNTPGNGNRLAIFTAN